MIEVALVTGGHPFDVKGLHRAFHGMDGIDVWPQGLEDYAFQGDGYDVVVLYNFQQPTPAGDGFPDAALRMGAERLGSTDQGIVVLHHGLAAFPQWELWNDIVGIADRAVKGVHFEQKVEVKVEKDHPITSGLGAFVLEDETYEMAEPGAGNEVLLVTDHEQSMRSIAWARTYKRSRVFCLQSGHDNLAFANPAFREVLRRGIVWTAPGKSS